MKYFSQSWEPLPGPVDFRDNGGLIVPRKNWDYQIVGVLLAILVNGDVEGQDPSPDPQGLCLELTIGGRGVTFGGCVLPVVLAVSSRVQPRIVRVQMATGLAHKDEITDGAGQSLYLTRPLPNELIVPVGCEMRLQSAGPTPGIGDRALWNSSSVTWRQVGPDTTKVGQK